MGLKLVNETDGYEYDLRMVQRLGPEPSKSYSHTKADRPANNILYDIVGGKDNTFPLVFIIKERSSGDMSLGTASNIPSGSDANFTDYDSDGNVEIRTLREQIFYLDRFLYNGAGGVQFRIYDTDANDNATQGFWSDPDGDGILEGYPVGIEDMPLPEPAGQLSTVVRARLKAGQVL